MLRKVQGTWELNISGQVAERPFSVYTEKAVSELHKKKYTTMNSREQMKVHFCQEKKDGKHKFRENRLKVLRKAQGTWHLNKYVRFEERPSEQTKQNGPEHNKENNTKQPRKEMKAKAMATILKAKGTGH